MRDDTVIGLPAEMGLSELHARGLAAACVITAAPARPGSGPAGAEDRVPHIVRVADGEAVCALFRIADPAKENERLE